MDFDEPEWVRQQIDRWLRRHGLMLALAGACALALANLWARG